MKFWEAILVIGLYNLLYGGLIILTGETLLEPMALVYGGVIYFLLALLIIILGSLFKSKNSELKKKVVKKK